MKNWIRTHKIATTIIVTVSLSVVIVIISRSVTKPHPLPENLKILSKKIEDTALYQKQVRKAAKNIPELAKLWPFFKVLKVGQPLRSGSERFDLPVQIEIEHLGLELSCWLLIQDIPDEKKDKYDNLTAIKVKAKITITRDIWVCYKQSTTNTISVMGADPNKQLWLRINDIYVTPCEYPVTTPKFDGLINWPKDN